MNLQTKLRMYEALILSTLLYGAEVWPLTVTLSKKLEAADHRMGEQALHWEVAGFGIRPGRPRMKWRDVVKKDLQRMGLTWEEVEASAQDRHSWRQRVALCIGDAG